MNVMRSFNPDQLFRANFTKYSEIESIVASPESCALMRDMTQLGFPALDALHHVPVFMELNCRVSRIATERQYNMFKTMVGRLVKHVMRELGFEEVDPGNPINTRISPVFTTGAQYRPIQTS